MMADSDSDDDELERIGTFEKGDIISDMGTGSRLGTDFLNVDKRMSDLSIVKKNSF